jgi:mono/diheme cytochrome c family protein
MNTRRIPGLILLVAISVMPTPVLAQEAERLYLDKCANCHGADGAGQTIRGKKLRLKDLRSTEVQKQTDAQWTELLLKGKGGMPGYAKELNEKQIKDLILHMRNMKSKK